MSTSLSRPSLPTRFAVVQPGDPVPDCLRGAIAALGNFDGVHRGHQRLIAAAQETARASGRPAAALTFEPHPRSFFNPDPPLFRLTPEPVKLAILAKLGLDGAFVRRFDAGLASLAAAAFVDLLQVDLGLSGVVVGHDFQFGRGREGTIARLEALCRERRLTCTVVAMVTLGSTPVSSSAIRAALEAGDIAGANALLGYRWFVRGTVRHGDKRGRTLGFPTANLRLPDGCRLRHGIYAVRAALAGRPADGQAVWEGVASFGRRPTFDNGAPLLEVHLFDFSGDLYGLELDVEFVGWIRGEERFDGADALVARMHEDVREARAALARATEQSFIG